jgi:excisionase family DNA binding protein
MDIEKRNKMFKAIQALWPEGVPAEDYPKLALMLQIMEAPKVQRIPSAETPKEALSVAEAAKFMHYSRPGVYQAIKAGRLHAYRDASGHLVLSKPEVIAYVESAHRALTGPNGA